MIEANLLWALAIAVVIALSARPIVRHIQARRRRALVLSYCQRAADGEIYVEDPQTGTMHKLSEQIMKRVAPEDTRTPRQRRKAQRCVKAALRA